MFRYIKIITVSGAMVLSATGVGANEARRFSENVSLHVIAHEIGHAVIREFDLPILSSEEDMAEQFATYVIDQNLPEDAEEIIEDRIASLRIEGDQTSVYSEYSSDVRRAGQIACLFYGMDPGNRTSFAERVGMSGKAKAHCADRGPEIARSWRRVLKDLWLPEGAAVTEVLITHDPSQFMTAFSSGRTGYGARKLLASLDWHSQIKLDYAQCDGTAGWGRNRRRIHICESYVRRFMAQAVNLDDKS